MRVALGGKSSQVPENTIEPTKTILTTPTPGVKQNITVMSTKTDGRNGGK